MTIIDALQEANTEAGIHTLAFANLNEFKTFMESFSFSDYPVNVIVPITSNGTHTTQGRRKATLPLQGWVLTRIIEEPLDLRSLKAEHDYIEPMRAKAISFIQKLLETDIIDPEVDNVTDNIQSVFGFTEAHLFGVSYTVNIPMVEMSC